MKNKRREEDLPFPSFFAEEGERKRRGTKREKEKREK